MVQFNGEIGQGIFFQRVFLYYLKYIFAKFTQLTHLQALHVFFISLNWKVTVQYHSFKKARKTICWTLLSLFTRSSRNWNEESNWHRNTLNFKASSLGSVSEHGFEKWSRTRSNKLWCGKWKTSHCSQVKPS